MDDRGEVLFRRTSPAERCENGTLRLDDTQDTWGMGRCCLHCGLPVNVTIAHPRNARGSK